MAHARCRPRARQLDMDYVCAKDTDQPPLYHDDTLMQPTVPGRASFVQRKAASVLYMLERTVGQLLMRDVLRRLVARAFESRRLALSTKLFLRIARKVTGRGPEIVLLAQQFVYRPGCPKFRARLDYSRKKDFVVLYFEQTCTHPGILPYVGPLTIRVHETTGACDHIVNIVDATHMCVPPRGPAAPPRLRDVLTSVVLERFFEARGRLRFEFPYKSKQKKLRQHRTILDPDTYNELRTLAVRPANEAPRVRPAAPSPPPPPGLI